MASKKAKKTSRPTVDQSDANPPAASPEDLRQQRQRAQMLSGHRESVESICVAIILALLFRSFIAEAFVIPTGSMAPVLMGAHKDLFCDQCNHNFQVGASIEQRDPQTMQGAVGRVQSVVAGRCPNCKKRNDLHLASNRNHETFSGDRILVSKFAYALAEPKRWDVIVFKYPGNPKQNYIKRLIGLPDETLRVHHGDIFTRPKGQAEFTIARKPDHKVLPTSHLIFDSDYQPSALLDSEFPSRLQPWQTAATAPPGDGWQVQKSANGLLAKVAPGSERQWLRYYHNIPTDDEWERAVQGGKLDSVDPYRSRAITDFYAYNSYFTVDRDQIRDNTGRLRASYRDGELPARIYDNGESTGSLHWVGDLTFEVDLSTDRGAKELTLEIIEAGVRYRCAIDMTNGKATLSIEGDELELFDHQVSTVSADTAIRAGKKYSLRFSNVDEQLRLWINNKSIVFDSPATFNPRNFQTRHDSRPHFTTAHPLDAAPVGIAAMGGETTITRFRLFRDQYYIATLGSMPMNDYAWGNLPTVRSTLSDPTAWDESGIWEKRQQIEFVLEADQFFPMGDNSPESKDARCWVDATFGEVPDQDAYLYAKASYVPRDLLVGKALAVFWPHVWNRPIPYTPNLRRVRLIR